MNLGYKRGSTTGIVPAVRAYTGERLMDGELT